MTFDTTGKISIAQLAFFAAALGPANYVMWKHGAQGIMGWIFISLFCVVRIVGAAIIIHDESGGNPISEAGLIISSVAIAPLIIATSGIAHESYQSLRKYSKFLYGFHPHVSVHVATAGAIALLIVGFIKIDSDSETVSEKKTGLDLIRAGAVILLAVWAFISALFMSSFRHPRAVRAEKQLTVGIAVALVALLLRILYTVLAALLNTPSFNIATGGTTAEKIVMSVVSEFVLVLALLISGFASREINQEEEAHERVKGSHV